MPQAVVVPFITAIVGSAAAAAVIYTVAQTILINLVLGAISKKLASRGRSDQGPPPINITIRGTIEPRHLVFGTRRVGGLMAFVEVSSSAGSSTNDYLWYVIVLAGHQCSSITDVWLDTEKISNSDINAGTGAVTGGKFSGKIYIWKYLGTGTQAADTNLDTASTYWTSNHKLQGCAYVVLRMQRDTEVFTGAPGNITALVSGVLAYDPRLDSTNGGSGSHRMTNPSTWAFTANPALLARWYLTGGSVTNESSTRMIRYGLKEPDTRIDDTYIVAAANICDEPISGINVPPTGGELRYKCHLESTCGENRRDVFGSILLSMAGTAVNVHGKWRVYAGAYDIPAHSITDDDVYGDIEIQDTTPRTERFNAVSATYVDAIQGYAEATTILRTDSAYEAQDGNEQITKELDLRAVTSGSQAQRLCEIELRKSRMQRTMKLVGALNLLKIAPNETYLFTHSRYSWTSRVFRLQERQFEYAEDAGRVSITGVRDDAGVWADLLTADYTTGTSVTDVFTNDGPDAPTSLSITSYPNGLRFTIGLPAYMPAGSWVELWEYTSSTPFSSATRIGRSKTSFIDLHKRDITGRYYWVRIVALNGAASATFPVSTGQAGVADQVQTEDMADNSATEVYTVTDDGPDTLSLPSGSQTDFQYLYVDVTPPVDCTATIKVTTSARKGLVGTATTVGCFYQTSPFTGGVLPSSGSFYLTTTEANYKGQLVIALDGGTTYRMGLYFAGNPGGSSDSMFVRSSAAIIELIKR